MTMYYHSVLWYTLLLRACAGVWYSSQNSGLLDGVRQLGKISDVTTPLVMSHAPLRNLIFAPGSH
jgi:hypothetical protein